MAMIETTTTKSISIKELNSLLKTDRQPILIDTLPQKQFQQKHLPDAANACVFEVNFLDQVDTICSDKKRSIVVYGANEQTYDAKTAAEKLQRAGYESAAVLTGGLKAWQVAGYKLAGDSVDEVDLDLVSLADGRYQVDTDTSLLEWAGRNPNSTHRGTLRLVSGEMQIEAGQIRGNFTIDMNSIENLNLAGDDLKPVLESHLLSDDFFFVKQFPKATFEMKATPTAEGQAVSSPNYQVNGQLKLCGISAEQSFRANIVPTGDGKIMAEAHFDLDRTRWGVIYGSAKFFKHLGMHLVFDDISLQLRLATK
jgi:polyisoprenoid-binding protein YceI